jgi:hypothetical protein
MRSPIPVTYLGTDPRISRIPGEAPTYHSLESAWITVFGIGFVTLVIFLKAIFKRETILSIGIWSAVRARLLERRGRLLRGEVINFREQEIHYRFFTPDGRMVENRKKVGRSPSTYNFASPERGTPVAVVYMNDRLHEIL